MTRKHLPDTRDSVTRHEAAGKVEFYVTVGFYEDTPMVPGEVFITISKEGSTLAGLCNMVATAISVGLQYGVPWEKIEEKFRHTKFEPSGTSLDATQEFSSLGAAIVDAVKQCINYRAERLDMGEVK